MRSKTVRSDAAPKAIGPYSQATQAGELLFCSGQIGMDPATGEVVEGGTREQTRRALENLAAVLSAAGCTMEDVVKTTVFLADLSDFTTMNDVYAGYFDASPPARSTVEVAALPKGATVEIEAIALRSDST